MTTEERAKGSRWIDGDNTTDLLQKTKIYLYHGEQAPPGAVVQTGPQGGKFYNSRLVTHPHVWERTQERSGAKREMYDAFKKLELMDLPKDGWYYQLPSGGFVVGYGKVIKTLLTPTMAPKGTRMND